MKVVPQCPAVSLDGPQTYVVWYAGKILISQAAFLKKGAAILFGKEGICRRVSPLRGGEVRIGCWSPTVPGKGRLQKEEISQCTDSLCLQCIPS